MGKQEINGTILKVNSVDEDNRTLAEILFLTKENNKIYIRDENFFPYFRIVLRDENFSLKELEDNLNSTKITKEDFYVVKLEREDINLSGEEKKTLKVFINKSKHIAEFSNVIKNKIELGHNFEDENVFKHMEDVYENDIPFKLRYSIDKRLLFHHETSLEIEKRKEKSDNKKIIYANEVKLKKLSKLDLDSLNGILAYDIETETKTKEINMEKNEIISIAFYSENRKEVFMVLKENNSLDKKKLKITGGNFRTFNSEKEMIEEFWRVTREFPAIVGYNSTNFDIPYLVKRSEINNIDLEELGITSKKGYFGYMFDEFINFDLYEFFRYFFSRGSKVNVDSFSLNDIAQEFLSEQKLETDYDFVLEGKSEEELNKIAQYNMKDTELTFRLFKKFEVSILDILNLVPIDLDNINSSSTSQVNDAFLMYNAHEMREMIPKKPDDKTRTLRSSRFAVGAFVYQPKKGLFKDIYVYDFRSLYPSIIAAYNICPTTVVTEKEIKEKNIKKEDLVEVPFEDDLKNKFGKVYFLQSRDGLISKNIRKILKERIEIKTKLKGAKGIEKDILKARSYSLKIIMNSIYGYIGFSNARWYSHECAQSITAFGRHHLSRVIEKVKEKGFEVIYGDTDSVFFSSKTKNKKEISNFADSLNEDLKDPMFLELEGFFDTGIFVGVKKRYTLYNKKKDEFKITGFETIRSDTCELVKEVQKNVLTYLLRDEDVEKTVKYFEDKVNALRNHEVDKNKLLISYKMKKDPEEYTQNAPHVRLAKKLIKRGREIKKGSVVTYIICSGEGSISERATLPEECDKYDSEYYIYNQILPTSETFFDLFDINITKKISKQKSLFDF